MQISHFTSGGFVIHKIRVHDLTSARISAWYDAAGRLLDGELIYDGFNRPLPSSGPLRDHVAKLGQLGARA